MSRKIGRNERCPCGSGRKYKNCCINAEPTFSPEDAGPRVESGGTNGSAEAGAGQGAHPRLAGGRRTHPAAAVRAAAREATVWEAGVIPAAVHYEDEPLGRPTMTIVTADGFVVEVRADVKPLGEVDEIARHLERVIVAAKRGIGRLPERIDVRHEEVAAALADRLAGRGVTVTAGPLRDWEEAAREVHAGVAGFDDWPTVSVPECWMAWGLPRDTIARFFDAAAALYASGGRDLLAAGDVFEVMPRDGRTWTVLPAYDEQGRFGFTLFADPTDAVSFEALPGLAGWIDIVLMIAFVSRSDLPEPMVREIATSGWTVASADAYPRILLFNTPAGGLSRNLADRFTIILDTLAAFLEECIDDIESGNGGRPLLWVHPEHYSVLRFQPDSPFEWPIEDPLGLALAAGPGADPALATRLLSVESLDDDADRTIRAFRTSLVSSGLKEPTVRKHVENVDSFLHFLAVQARVPPAAATERDLRFFLYDWYPLRERAWSRQDAIRTSLRRFFAWLEIEHGIEYPWAAPILGDSRSFYDRAARAARALTDADRMREWEREIHVDIAWRAMAPSIELGGETPWDPVPGTAEERFWSLLYHSWMLWREELIHAGITDRTALVDALVARQKEWTTSPGNGGDGRSILDVVLDERANANASARAASTMGRRRGRASRAKPGRASHPKPIGPARLPIDGRVWQLYCAIDEIEPPIWRRIEVPGDTTLRTLHRIIQEAFGWDDAHLHLFERGDLRWGNTAFDGLSDLLDEGTAHLAEVVPDPRDVMFYQYDFGDSWWHVVLVERVFTPGDPSAYPRLLDGRRACPPEDSGGPWFYDELLEIVDDPDHPDHEERIEWLGDRFDPEAFDAAAADRRLARFRTTPVRKPARTRPDIGPGAGDTGAQDRPDAADASGPPDHAGVTGNVAASHNFRAVLATLDRAAQRRPIDPAALDTARRLLEAHAAAEPGDLARLYKPAVWAAGALHAAFMLSDPDTAPSATQLAAGFGVSAPAVGSRSRTLRRHAPALELQREDDDADDSRPRRGLLRLL